MRRTALITFVAGLALFTVLVAVPFVTKKRDQPASITSPAPLQAVALDILRPGQRLCMNEIAIDAHSQVARFRVGTYSKPGPPLGFDIAGQGYSVTRKIAGGYPDNALQAVPVPAPSSSKLVRVCLRNDGRVKIAVYAASDRARSRASVMLGRSTVYATPTFGFWESKPQSIAARASVTAQRIAVFRGPLGYTWVVYLVAAATLVALTLGLGIALWKVFNGAQREY